MACWDPTAVCAGAPRRPRELLNVHRLKVGKERRRFLQRSEELYTMFESIYRNATGSSLERLSKGCRSLHKTQAGKKLGLPAPCAEDFGLVAPLAERALGADDTTAIRLGDAFFLFRAWLVALFVAPLVRAALADDRDVADLMRQLNGGQRVLESEVEFVEAAAEDLDLEDMVLAIALWYSDVPTGQDVGGPGGPGCSVQ